MPKLQIYYLCDFFSQNYYMLFHDYWYWFINFLYFDDV
jgi:hypothetical protein